MTGHPLFGQTLPLLERQRKANREYVLLEHPSGRRFRVPVGWTNLAPPIVVPKVDGREVKVGVAQLLTLVSFVRDRVGESDRNKMDRSIDLAMMGERASKESANAGDRDPERTARHGRGAFVGRARREDSEPNSRSVGNARAKSTRPSKRGDRR